MCGSCPGGRGIRSSHPEVDQEVSVDDFIQLKESVFMHLNEKSLFMLSLSVLVQAEVEIKHFLIENLDFKLAVLFFSLPKVCIEVSHINMKLI